MKKMISVFFAGIIFISCNNNGNTSKESTNDSTKDVVATTKMNYPYTIDHPDNWEAGSQANTLTVLNSLKAFENGNIDESLKYFDDSIHVMFDGMDSTLSKDALKSMFTKSKESIKSMQIKMYDWESVISKDKKDEYVTLWYKQNWEDKDGKKDSANLVNDLKIKNGKIIELSEYTRRYH